MLCCYINISFKIRDHIADLIDLLQSRQINLLILGKVLEEILLDENVSCKQVSMIYSNYRINIFLKKISFILDYCKK